MTNGKVRFFSVAIAGILAGCSALGGMFGSNIASTSTPEPVRKGIGSVPGPQASQEATSKPTVTTKGNVPAPKQTTPSPANDTPTPTLMPTPTRRPCPTDGSRLALGTLQSLPGGIGQALYFELRCGVGDQDWDEKPVAFMSIGDRLWMFAGNDKLDNDYLSVFRMEEAKSDSLFFSQPSGYSRQWEGSKNGYIYWYSFAVGINDGMGNVRFSEQSLPGDVESRASSSLTFTEQGKSRFGSPTFEWPCAPDEEYGDTKVTVSNPDPPDLSSLLFAVGDLYIVRSTGTYQYEYDANNERWLTAKKVIQAVRRDGRAFKIISKYQWPYNDVWRSYEQWARGGGSWGLDSFVWSVQLKAFVRNPYGFGLSEFNTYQYEVLTEGDLDTLLAANEGSPCGIE